MVIYFAGLTIHTFHGNFFVRSTDLLSLPNINPDAGFGMQVSIEENLTDSPYACLQAALLYTSSKGSLFTILCVYCYIHACCLSALSRYCTVTSLMSIGCFASFMVWQVIID